eukprot:9468521-Pyramimonas_sp.AAC.1
MRVLQRERDYEDMAQPNDVHGHALTGVTYADCGLVGWAQGWQALWMLRTAHMIPVKSEREGITERCQHDCSDEPGLKVGENRI